MITVDYSHNGVNVSAAVATDSEALSLANALYDAYGVWPKITYPTTTVPPFKHGDRIRVSAWSGEWFVISVEPATLWLRPWQGLGEPKGAPVSLCECV
jgi:hypothetical protein